MNNWTTFLTAGRAIFTIEPSQEFVTKTGSQAHYTFKIGHCKANERWPESWMICLLTGPDNEHSYTYVGKLDPKTGEVRLTARSRYSEATLPVQILRRVLARLFAGDEAAITKAGWAVHHECKCGRCGRTLTVPESILTGIGPECASRMSAA